MAWGFRRSKRICPFRLNFSKSGVGWSAGVRGFRIGRDASGRRYTAASIPGTGLYSRSYSSSGTERSSSARRMPPHVISPEEQEYRAAIERELNRLPESERDPCLQEVVARWKSPATAQLLWFIGSQYAYLDNWPLQIIYWLTIGGYFIWALIDIFRIPGMVYAYNRRVAIPMLQEAVAARLAKNGRPQATADVTPSSSVARYGLYQAIAFAREHIQFTDPEREDLNAIEQYFLWNETAILIAPATATVASSKKGRAKIASDSASIPPNPGPTGFLVVTDHRVMYWSTASTEAVFYTDIVSIDTTVYEGQQKLEIVTRADRIEVAVDQVPFLSRLISTRKEIALRQNATAQQQSKRPRTPVA